MGRRLLLDDTTERVILDHSRNGNYIKTACLAAGVGESTFYSWVHKAESGEGNGNKVYIEFLEEVKRAEAENIAKNVKIIQKAGTKAYPNAWTASAWLLERKYPSEYGRRMELEVGPSKVLIALQEQAQRLTTLKVIESPREEHENISATS